MTTDPTEPRVEHYLRQQCLSDAVTKVLPLTGDASDRRYFRVLLRGAESIVLALHTGPIDFEQMAFVRVARLFARVPLPVPQILHHSNELGIIGLQDLGDVTLQAHLGAASHEEHDALYRQAVSFIARLQQRGAELASDDEPPYRIAFDTDKLAWEFEFFYKYFLKAYRGASPSAAVQAALSKEWSSVVEELATEPRVLCHRDYHSRNLMLKANQLVIIDFQDARMGPDTYDLVSLLRDSYVDLTPRQVDELIAYFLALRQGASDVSNEPAAEFRRRFDVMALQRHFKALGTFGYQTVTRGNAVYIQYIPRTLNYLRGNLSKYPRFAPMQELLAPLIEELRSFRFVHLSRPVTRPADLSKEPAVSSPRFGVSTHLVHDQRLERDHLVEIAAHGFECVEVFATRSHFDYHDSVAVRSLAEWLEDTRLALNSMHAPITSSFSNGAWGDAYSNAAADDALRQRAVLEAEAALAVAQTVPYRYLVVHLGVPDEMKPLADNQRDAARRSVLTICELADKVGVRLALEVIPNALSRAETLVSFIEQDLEGADVGICMDVGHAFIMGDLGDAIEICSEHLTATHLHDNKRKSDDHLTPGEGGIDWPATLMALQKIGYEGAWMFEVANTSTPREVLAKTEAARRRFDDLLGFNFSAPSESRQAQSEDSEP